jgi:hypothetical protein
MSLGVSSSQQTSQAAKLSTGPTAFGSVNFAPNMGGGSSTWLWGALGAAVAVIALILFRRK